ncbi:MAG: ABC transporter ATP-binding protein, partial [Bacteroidales bacterium]|nr:ABC transporter ATP-binding protein [Bacteroidales bacterium]
MVRTENLVKIFTTDVVETTALNNLDIHIKKGEFVAITGPSGCGKSTLLNILGLLDDPTKGTYYFNGEDVSRYSETQQTRLRKGNIGFIFQNFHLINELSVYKNLELALLFLGVAKSERKKIILNVLERMDILHRAGHFPQQLSGGQQQRVAVARALVTNPKMILADEPTGNLDSKNGEEVMRMLEELNKEGTTVVMVTHSPSHAKRAHRTINLF